MPERIFNQILGFFLRMVLANGGVEVGAVIRSTEQYDLMKMKPTESKERYRCRLQLCQVYDPSFMQIYFPLNRPLTVSYFSFKH